VVDFYQRVELQNGRETKKEKRGKSQQSFLDGPTGQIDVIGGPPKWKKSTKVGNGQLGRKDINAQNQSEVKSEINAEPHEGNDRKQLEKYTIRWGGKTKKK